MDHHAAVAVRGKIYSFGDFCPHLDLESIRPIEVRVLQTKGIMGIL